MELDHAAALKQVQVEREDARRKIDTERARCAVMHRLRQSICIYTLSVAV